MGFFTWFRNLFRRPQWPGWWAIRTTRTDSPEDWRRMNDS